MFLVFCTVKVVYILEFTNCSTSYCLCDTLMDPWYVSMHAHARVCVCVCARARARACVCVCVCARARDWSRQGAILFKLIYISTFTKLPVAVRLVTCTREVLVFFSQSVQAKASVMPWIQLYPSLSTVFIPLLAVIQVLALYSHDLLTSSSYKLHSYKFCILCIVSVWAVVSHALCISHRTRSNLASRIMDRQADTSSMNALYDSEIRPLTSTSKSLCSFLYPWVVLVWVSNGREL